MSQSLELTGSDDPVRAVVAPDNRPTYRHHRRRHSPHQKLLGFSVVVIVGVGATAFALPGLADGATAGFEEVGKSLYIQKEHAPKSDGSFRQYLKTSRYRAGYSWAKFAVKYILRPIVILKYASELPPTHAASSEPPDDALRSDQRQWVQHQYTLDAPDLKLALAASDIARWLGLRPQFDQSATIHSIPTGDTKDPCDCKFVGTLSLTGGGQTLTFETRAMARKEPNGPEMETTDEKGAFPLNITALREPAPSFFAAPSWKGSLTGRLYDKDAQLDSTTVSLTAE